MLARLSLGWQRTVGRIRQKHPFGGAVEVFQLAALHRPEEGNQPDDAHSQRDGDQLHVIAHVAHARGLALPPPALARFAGRAPERRKALATTRMEEVDIATAAMSGVT